METLKLFTPTEGGKWNVFAGNVKKDTVIEAENNGLGTMLLGADGEIHSWGSLMFSDGTIYDKSKKAFRPEKYFPKADTVAYMNKILNKEI